MTPLEQIKHLYFNTTKSTIQRDVARAIELLKQMSTEDERQDAAVYMDGLSQMRSEWAEQAKGHKPKAKRNPTRHQR